MPRTEGLDRFLSGPFPRVVFALSSLEERGHISLGDTAQACLTLTLRAVSHPLVLQHSSPRVQTAVGTHGSAPMTPGGQQGTTSGILTRVVLAAVGGTVLKY